MLPVTVVTPPSVNVTTSEFNKAKINCQADFFFRKSAIQIEYLFLLSLTLSCTLERWWISLWKRLTQIVGNAYYETYNIGFHHSGVVKWHCIRFCPRFYRPSDPVRIFLSPDTRENPWDVLRRPSRSHYKPRSKPDLKWRKRGASEIYRMIPPEVPNIIFHEIVK